MNPNALMAMVFRPSPTEPGEPSPRTFFNRINEQREQGTKTKPARKKRPRKKTKAEIEAEQREEDERKQLAEWWSQGERSKFVPGRELVSAARAIKSHHRFVANGSPWCGPSNVGTWRNFGECCGTSFRSDDIDGVGSWGRHVRQWEDRDDE